MRWLAWLLHQLESGPSILDLGCGSGDPADVEIAKNHKITEVDIFEVQIKLAQENIPSGVLIHEDVSKIDFLLASFDAVVSFYTLEHIPREEHSELFRLALRLARLMASLNGWAHRCSLVLLARKPYICMIRFFMTLPLADEWATAGCAARWQQRGR